MMKKDKDKNKTNLTVDYDYAGTGTCMPSPTSITYIVHDETDDELRAAKATDQKEE
jgi:hypothetical protein